MGKTLPNSRALFKDFLFSLRIIYTFCNSSRLSNPYHLDRWERMVFKKKEGPKKEQKKCADSKEVNQRLRKLCPSYSEFPRKDQWRKFQPCQGMEKTYKHIFPEFQLLDNTKE